MGLRMACGWQPCDGVVCVILVWFWVQYVQYLLYVWLDLTPHDDPEIGDPISSTTCTYSVLWLLQYYYYVHPVVRLQLSTTKKRNILRSVCIGRPGTRRSESGRKRSPALKSVPNQSEFSALEIPSKLVAHPFLTIIVQYICSITIDCACVGTLSKRFPLKSGQWICRTFGLGI